ncbi:hypothetical protein OCS_01133 [Ophiocordyceps sinensis CO18]|uniref:Uncharacterized protein n=1 Tax=Ophiocordyceps sinensis (strain Co18 / CGMCC 3.14243) TaxID=911162 RepID=T5AMX2_OPHSC|nr:hypothetical protein OCS_01133 [Ophiocordyceps sinensis CO18]
MAEGPSADGKERNESQANLDDVDDGSHAVSSDSEDDLDQYQDITPSSTNGTFSHGITFPSFHIDNPTAFEREWYKIVKKEWGDCMMFFDQPEAKLLVVYVKECITREKVAHERLGKEIRVGHWVAWLLVRTVWPRSKIKAFKMYSIFKQYWNEDQEDRLFWILYPTEWPIALPKQARIRLQTIRQLQKWQSKLQDPEIRDALQRKRIDGNWYEKRMATDIMERLESDDRDEKIQDYMESLAKQGLPEPKQTKKRTAPPDVQASPQRKRRIRSGLATPQTTPPQPSPAVPTSNMSKQLEALEESMETLKQETRGLRACMNEQTKLLQQMQGTCNDTLLLTKAMRTYTTVVLCEMGYDVELE